MCPAAAELIHPVESLKPNRRFGNTDSTTSFIHTVFRGVLAQASIDELGLHPRQIGCTHLLFTYIVINGGGGEHQTHCGDAEKGTKKDQQHVNHNPCRALQ